MITHRAGKHKTAISSFPRSTLDFPRNKSIRKNFMQRLPGGKILCDWNREDL
jgi:hypothetical protein